MLASSRKRAMPNIPLRHTANNLELAGGHATPQPHKQHKKKNTVPEPDTVLFGGDYRDRTGDLLHAMQALSQLS